jgi:hypothetical protein
VVPAGAEVVLTGSAVKSFWTYNALRFVTTQSTATVGPGNLSTRSEKAEPALKVL